MIAEPKNDPRIDEKRIGVILVTHSDYGTWLFKAAECILGVQEDYACVSVDVTNEVEQTVKHLKDAVRKLDKGKGVLILTDMFGGTPTNLSLSLLGTSQLEVVTGVNLPMLLKVLGSRRMGLAQIAAEAKSAGRQGIVVAGEILRSKVSED